MSAFSLAVGHAAVMTSNVISCFGHKIGLHSQSSKRFVHVIVNC